MLPGRVAARLVNICSTSALMDDVFGIGSGSRPCCPKDTLLSQVAPSLHPRCRLLSCPSPSSALSSSSSAWASSLVKEGPDSGLGSNDDVDW